ncbi:hypothetical protein [Paenilisteria newyorkensis]|uniref:hypothetical protein n=1 Tax=Listeria newyorkensis TaxID=1497681 RepID=UPI000669DF3D|nr:hypothetical protein [Listeria newyorkensis]KMT63633.1 hypothetical protein X559_0024 [Listeria newyorkensis]
MKKIIVAVLVGILLLAGPVATEAANVKGVIVQKQNVYTVKGKMYDYGGSLARGAVIDINPANGNRIHFRQQVGYLYTNFYVAPARTGAWAAAVVRATNLNVRSTASANSGIIKTLVGNSVIRINTAGLVNGFYPVAYLEHGYWQWKGFVSAKYVIRVDNMAVGSMAVFTTL